MGGRYGLSFILDSQREVAVEVTRCNYCHSRDRTCQGNQYSRTLDSNTCLQTKIMTAIRYHGRGDIRLDTVEEPRCGKGDVKVLSQTAI